MCQNDCSVALTYDIFIFPGESAKQKIESLCIEQSIEIPLQLVSKSINKNHVGTPSSIKKIDYNIYRVIIDYPLINIGNSITQFLNILFGNISLINGICCESVAWNQLPKTLFRGPAFGVSQIRKKLHINNPRPLAAAVLKPLGLSIKELGDLCYKIAAGGIDIIKDDHGLVDPNHCPI